MPCTTLSLYNIWEQTASKRQWKTISPSHNNQHYVIYFPPIKCYICLMPNTRLSLYNIWKLTTSKQQWKTISPSHNNQRYVILFTSWVLYLLNAKYNAVPLQQIKANKENDSIQTQYFSLVCEWLFQQRSWKRA